MSRPADDVARLEAPSSVGDMIPDGRPAEDAPRIRAKLVALFIPALLAGLHAGTSLRRALALPG